MVEGAVNARAREFARSIAEGQQNDNAPFTNIDIGKYMNIFSKVILLHIHFV